MEWKNLDKCTSFTQLQKVHKEQAENLKLADIFNTENSVKRVKNYSVKMGGNLKYNYAAKPVNDEILKALQSLADEQKLIEKYELLLNGDFINTGENRMVLHQLTRGQLKNDVVYKGVNMRSFYLNELKKIKEFSEAVHSGKMWFKSE